MKKRKLFYCLLISILFLIICTKTSPLYKINDWYDANAFFTVGKSMFHGKVPYLELFEQKGPLLYLIYGLASIISYNSFIGVFLIEIIFMTISFYYISKIIEFYLPKKMSYLLIPILAMLILSSRSFTHGGSCEELTFPFLIMTIYYFINYLKNNILTNKQILLIGILAGFTFWIKYTLLGFQFGFWIVILIKELKQKEGKDLLQKIGYFLLGILITTVPWIIYFGMNKGLKSLIDTYFLFNITSYAEKINFIEKIINCIQTIKGVLLKYYQYLILILIPMIISIKKKFYFKERENNVYLLLCTILLLVFLFIGGTNYRYYSLPMQPFMIFGLIYIAQVMIRIDKKKFIENHTKYLLIIVIIACLLISYNRSPNTKYIKYKKEDYAQFVFQEKIGKEKTILNYGFLDGGFYLTTNKIPTVYYFMKNNINYNLYPNNADEQRKYVENKLVDYVIASDKIKNIDKEILEQNYRLILTHKQRYEEKYRTYYLYEKK